jgi:thioredoxin reductase (NADPH)
VASAAILIAHHDPASRDRLRRIVQRRFGADYEVVVAGTADGTLAALRRLRERDADVALVLAEQWLPDLPGADLLARVPEIVREARRGLLVTWADRTTADWIVKASALGQIDAHVVEPSGDADERFFLAIGELLTEWEQQHRPPFAAIRIVGDPWDSASHALRDALQRSGVPLRFEDATGDEGRALVTQAGKGAELPLAVLFDGRVLSRPSAAQVAEALGVNADVRGERFDVTIVGSGPSGLAAAVYAASEGLRVLVLEREAIGGQASSSSLIRNYLGFPRGLSGAELTNRAYIQAWGLGAQSVIGRAATGLRLEPDAFTLELDDGSAIRSRAVILACGVSYRRIGIESLEAFVGRGVFYGAGVTEAPAMANEPVYVVGGANSAGQAALYLSRFAKQVTILVRGPVLEEMSEYLVREIGVRDNIAVRVNTVIAEAHGDSRLRMVTIRDTASGQAEDVPATAVFIMIGAAPRTDWLPPDISRDAKGFILTGDDAVSAAGGSTRAALETSVSGVFAVGDVRHGSMKRVAAAVGEGSTAVRFVHEYLARRPNPEPVQRPHG